MPSKIEAHRLTKKYKLRGKELTVLEGVDVAIESGRFVCLLGPSGCGKSTFLRCVAGLEQPSSGFVSVDGRTVTAPGPDRAMVFQDYALFPWCTVEENIRFGLELKANDQLAKSPDVPKIDALLKMTKLEAFRSAYPHQISGGMRQRVAIARALAVRPEILLLDEPFAAVDAITRESLQKDLTEIWSEFGKTILFVTHSVDEAALLADEVLVFGGKPALIQYAFQVEAPRPRKPTDKHVVEAAAVLRDMLQGTHQGTNQRAPS